MLGKLFRPNGAERVDLLHWTLRICHRLNEPRLVDALMVKFLLDCFTRLCRNMTRKNNITERHLCSGP